MRKFLVGAWALLVFQVVCVQFIVGEVWDIVSEAWRRMRNAARTH